MDIPASYHAFIEWLMAVTRLPDTVLHIHAGMGILVIGRLFSRRSLGTLVPLYAVVIAELGNEVMDRLYFGQWRWPDTLSDVANTLFWPAIICLAVRLRPLVIARI